MENLFDKPKTYQRVTKTSMKVEKLRPDLQAFAPNLPWHDFSLEGGYIFSHLDGQMVGTYKIKEEIFTRIIE